MSEQPPAVVPLRDFPGLQLEVDERDLSDGGSHEQVNTGSLNVGSLRTRGGYRPVTFEDD